MRKIDKVIIFSILGVLPACLILFFLWNTIWGPSTKQVITETDLSENVNGVVDSLFDDRANHNVRTAILKNHYVFQIESQWASKIEIGDSLNKKKGSFLLEVYKKGNKKLILDYRSTLR
ncbi:hypothetical protein G7092_21760 [Mucilaginibacter sp. HC2]|uniref:hypothetical protein n=1 Tax=Mucilaginibacter inviolabilis TaxID=2714892 RepID=UPI0014098906|nr:hypothetical protein [Mucilaginibacter inviolabilis]NHA06451.1 hypothetical protein [Mucilaginibacter inviolabilis]